MANRFNEECVVRIWNNGKITSGHFGHAAISVRGPAVRRNFPDVPYVYISWWPGEGAGKTDALRRQQAEKNEYYIYDQYSEMADETRSKLEAYHLLEPHNFDVEDAVAAQFDLRLDGQIDQELYEKRRDLLRSGYRGYAPREGQKRKEGNDGSGAWVQAANEKIYLPGLGKALETADYHKEIRHGQHAQSVCSPRYWGLSTRRMAMWWNVWKDQNEYQLASKKYSCAGAAYQALREGGGEAFAKFPYKNLIFTEPNEIQGWAEKIGASINDFDRRTFRFDRTYKDPIIASTDYKNVMWAGDHLRPDLFTVQNWKAKSNVKHSSRSNIIKGIDSALADYHKYRWNEPLTFTKKFKSIVKVMEGVLKYTEQKPHGKRKIAVTALGAQVINVLGKSDIT